jgi:outer membrane immunogenic protein
MKFARTLMLGTAAALLSTVSVQAADLLAGPADPIYSSPLFDFEGFYVGATGGLATSGSLYGTLGVVVGSNFAVTDGIIVGGEFQGDLYFNGGGVSAADALALGRVGGFVSDNTMIYGELGLGIAGSSSVYAVGGGVEMAVTDQLAVRGELQGLGGFGAMPSIAKATGGLIWHLN